MSPGKTEDKENAPEDPIFSGAIVVQNAEGKTIEKIENGQAWFTTGGALVLKGGKKRHEIAQPVFAKPMTGADNFTLRISRFGAIRFSTPSGPSKNTFYWTCTQRNTPKKHADMPPPADDFGLLSTKALGNSMKPVPTPPLSARVKMFEESRRLEKEARDAAQTPSNYMVKVEVPDLPAARPPRTPTKAPLSNSQSPPLKDYPKVEPVKKPQVLELPQTPRIKIKIPPSAPRVTPALDNTRSPDAQRPVNFYGSHALKRFGPDLPDQRQTKSRRDRSPPRSEGIRNSGQTCYMAASLQMMYALPFKSNFQKIVSILEKKANGSGTLWSCLSQIFQLRDECKLVSVLPLRRTLSDLIQQFNDDRQEDAQEFLTAILSLLKTELRSAPIPRAHAPVESTFEWVAERTLQCRACGNKSEGSEHFDNMPLDLVGPMGRQIHLESLVTSFFKGGMVDWKCDKCGSDKASKTYLMRNLPPVIIVHLKRFWLDAQAMVVRKRNDPIAIPLQLDFGRWQVGVGRKNGTVPPRSLSELNRLQAGDTLSTEGTSIFLKEEPAANREPKNVAQKQNEEKKLVLGFGKAPGRYHLRSIVSHLGNKPMRGHYVTDVYDAKSESWTCFDDTTVTKGQKDASDKRKCTAYLLAYVHSSPPPGEVK